MNTQANQSPTNTGLAQVPAHVPPHLVLDFDYLTEPLPAPDFVSGLLSLAREAPGIFYTPRNGGHWVAIAHEAAFEFARNYDVFSNALDGQLLIPISLDPPEHKAHRSVLATVFAPQKVKALGESIRELAAELIQSIAGKGGCEFVSSVSEPLPVIIFMKIMGIPQVHLRVLRDLVEASMHESDHELRDVHFMKIAEITDEVVRERQKKRKDDLISQLIDTPIEGRALSFEELRAYIIMLLTGGLDTVVNAISLITRHLALDQELQANLRQNPEIIPEVLEELIRRYAITTTLRKVRKDYNYGEVPFRAGDMLLIHYQAAAVDPRAYPEPGRIVVGRKEPAISFGVGRHRCVGSHLARLELQIFIEEILSRIPTFRLVQDRPPTIRAGHVVSVENLHIRWD